MKQLRIFFAVLLTVVTLSHSKPSQAAVGAALSTPVLIAGLVITGASGALTLGTLHSCRSDNSGLCKGLTILILGPVVLLGLVVLDGEQKIEFKELSKEQAAQLGVSASELAVYNSEIDQANMLVGEVSAELSKIEKPSTQDSVEAWGAVKELVSPATYATMQKIVTQK